MRLDLYTGERERFLNNDCLCFTATNENQTNYTLSYLRCCPNYDLEATIVIHPNESIVLFGETDFINPSPGITLVINEGIYNCNECFKYNYKLYNCQNSEVIYTNYLECPECIQNINQMVYTYLEPNPCWYITVTDEPVGEITSVEINSEAFCPQCLPKCYTITGTGIITYFDEYYDLAIADAPARICSASYPSVSGTNNTITVTGNCNTGEPCPDYCYTLTNCVTQEVIKSTNQDLAFPFVLNEIVEIAERDGCWTITRSDVECDGEIPTTIIETYTTCEDCVPSLYYRLESCGNSEPIILYTVQNLSAYVGQTVSLDDYIGCYNVTIYKDQVSSPVTVTFKNNYPDCIQCAIPRYKLTDCDGIRNSIYTTTDLSSYLSSVIKLTFYPDTCWTVETSTINSSDDLVIVDSEYASCVICTTNTVCFCSAITNNSTTTQTFQFEDCDNNIQSIDVSANTLSREYCILKWIYPTGWNLPKIYSNNGACIDGKCPSGTSFRSIRPGYNSPACSEQYYEKIACRYANILYKDVIAQRYGIAPCCDQDDIYRLHIKFQLLEMQAINNPNYICNPFTPCCQKDDSCGCGCNS
jgi:hypothetical protein